jgi:hypothetical protein
MSKSLLLRWATRGLLFFSGVMFTTLLSKSMSSHLSYQISPHLAPVSLSVCRNVDMRWVHPAMSWSISVSFGMNGILRMHWYSGGFHVPPVIFRKEE